MQGKGQTGNCPYPSVGAGSSCGKYYDFCEYGTAFNGEKD